MTRRRGGFTLIELVFVILIGSILVSIAIASFQNAQNRFAARGAKDMYATMQARARARAIELGETVLFVVNTTGDSIFMVSDGAISDITNFRREMNVDLRATPAAFLMCMTPRGYADSDCPAYGFTATSSSSIKLEFWLNADSTSVTILPTGQLLGM